MSRYLRVVMLIVAAVLYSHSARSETDEAAQREILLQTCVDCHGSSGESVSPEVPHLDRQLASYLEESMDLLIKKQRPTKLAEHVPSSWTAEQVKLVATFYSASIPPRPPEPVDVDKATEGKEVFQERCQHCHENGGREPDSKGMGSAILAGQRIKYLENQINAYLTHKRKFLTVMKERAFAGGALVVNGHVISDRMTKLTKKDAELIAHYLAADLSEAAAEKKKKRRNSKG